MPASTSRRDKVRKALLYGLALVGGVNLALWVGAAGLKAMFSQPPESLREVVSPDGRYRILITEDLVGAPGSYCIKQVYVLGVHEAFDRRDEDNQVFAGACDGLTGIRWDGKRIHGSVNPDAAVAGVHHFTLRQFGANGKVELHWAAA